MKFLYLFVVFLLAFDLNARDFSTIKKKGEILIASEGAYAPFNYFKGNKIVGFEIDVANAVAKELGLKVKWLTFSFDSLLIGLKQDKYDVVIASHAITDQRKKAVDFTKPHYCSGGVIVSHKGGSKTKSDLKGKTVAVQVGTTYLQKLKQIDGIKKINTYPKDTDSFQNLLSKRVDALVTDKFLAIEAIKVHKDKADLQIGEYVSTEKIAMAVNKGNQKLITELNKGLDIILKNGTYKKISQRYFNQDIRCN